MSDLSMLLDMGFEEEKAKMAISKGRNLQGAIDWLDKNQEKSVEDLKAEQASAAAESSEGPALQPGEEARSLVCNDCGKKFRSTAQAEFHASKTEHTDFSESTEEIKPLTEEEKKAKLEELRQKLAEKRAGMSEQDKEDKRKNEEIRRKATKENQDIREDMARQEQIKEAAAKRREKQAEVDARKRVLEKLEHDKQERKRKAEIEKAKRAGVAPPLSSEPTTATASSSAASGSGPSKPASAYTETRLKLQMPTGSLTKSFAVETTLFEVAHAIGEEQAGFEVSSFGMTWPKKVFDKTDFGMTLKEAGMVPSAALIVK
ncbi:hypothetical protein K402DRAFT_392151 [Aulographum hederae CBS 113979]|uniref:C2H2-type domain-containing protein n=1 Tax=Aulographum hederae CBS 113979 TaxID=1176131 RepID=A0A6G1H4G9_9PEZI|nr:hypothetical protein K402DRAFT_392151 [Aulographum hederae CBS 113979]